MRNSVKILTAAFFCFTITPGITLADETPAANGQKPKIENLVPPRENGEFDQLPIKKGKFMFSVSLHKEREIDSLLTRADELSKVMRTNGNESRIALILHGPEVKFFTRKNYDNHRKIVDRAERLNRKNIIEVKICKTKLDEYGIKDSEIPLSLKLFPTHRMRKNSF